MSERFSRDLEIVDICFWYRAGQPCTPQAGAIVLPWQRLASFRAFDSLVRASVHLHAAAPAAALLGCVILSFAMAGAVVL